MESRKTQAELHSRTGSTTGGLPAAVLPDMTPAPFAAAVYPAKQGGCKGLAPFVETLKKSGVRVGGIIQEKVPLENGGMRRVDAVDIRSGRRIPLNRPTPETWRNRICSLDVSALADTSAILKRAVEDRVELMVVEKFGDAERDGEGLADEILQGIVAGVPLLIAVPETNLEAWSERTGELGATLSCDETALHEWWAWVRCEHANSARACASLG